MSRFFVALDPMHKALFGVESRSVVELYDGYQPRDLEEALRVKLLDEYPTEREAEEALTRWSAGPSRAPKQEVKS